MAIREIPGYSQYAIGAGCFFNKSPQIMIDDPDTGQQRREKVFTSDTEITVDDIDAELEFGERFAMEVAHAIGWIAPKAWRRMQAQLDELGAEAEQAVADKKAAEQAAEVAMRQAVAALTEKEEMLAQITALTSQAASLRGTISALKRQAAKDAKAVEAAENFGD